MLVYRSLSLAVVISYYTSVVLAAVQLTHLSTVYLPGPNKTENNGFTLDTGTVEQMSYDVDSKLIYVVGTNILHVVNGSNPKSLVQVHEMVVPDSDMTDVEVCGGYVFVTVDNTADRGQGQLRVYRRYSRSRRALKLVSTVVVGTIPDMLQVRPDCRTVIIALEAEAYESKGQLQDPKGAVVIIHFPEGVEGKVRPQVKTLDFTDYNNRYHELLPSGIRFVYRENNNTFSADVEPEYVAIDETGNKAYVVLQENNGVAEIDLVTETITAIHGLGYKQWGNLDTSDKDAGIEITYWPIRAWFLPDAIKFHQWRGRKLIFTANEGDTKKYLDFGFDETQRGAKFQESDLGSDIPFIMKDALKDNSRLGRLKFSKLDGRDEKGRYQSLYAFGGRSFSIWDAENSLQRIYDSGSSIEETTALYCPHVFNTDGDHVDDRSDDKGPQPEGLTVGEIGDRLYIFVGNESPGTISVYSIGSDVTQPRFESIFCEGIPNDSRNMTEKYRARQLYAVDPEDIRFYSGADNPTGSPILMVSGSTSGTVTILKINVDEHAQILSAESPANSDVKHTQTNGEHNDSALLRSKSSTILACLLVLLRWF
ncbi:uncharacterized protein LOC131950653 isoform X2 [Physella acuta]|uniref:uncharacterized protein LOC131950653 isoform X2 n=1 Tax=Physella acuta TaxID=109671 RepID=UPI0027DDEAA8|nr:uncharacterized protein LOC131950653 isoform X2 [Physella acuta]